MSVAVSYLILVKETLSKKENSLLGVARIPELLESFLFVEFTMFVCILLGFVKVLGLVNVFLIFALIVYLCLRALTRELESEVDELNFEDDTTQL